VNVSAISIEESAPDNHAARARTPWRPKFGDVARSPRADPGASVDVSSSTSGRRSDQVVVNFANVGATFARTILRTASRRQNFDWEGVRRCVEFLSQKRKLKVVGCIRENFKGPDNGSRAVALPQDIWDSCFSIQETPSLAGRKHASADDEMTIKCACRRNCFFMDNDNYRDWMKDMRDECVKLWLRKNQDALQMRYFFDSDLGTFDTLDGKSCTGPADTPGASSRTRERHFHNI